MNDRLRAGGKCEVALRRHQMCCHGNQGGNIRVMLALLVSSVLATVSHAGCAQIEAPLGADSWMLHGADHEFTEYRGLPALHLRDGVAVLDGIEIRNGVIEFDVAFTGERAFVGAFWRMRDDLNYEHFYFRPHQSGNPDANQYTPVFNGVTGWQLYHGKGYSAAVDYPLQAWIRVCIEFWEGQARVFIGSMDAPAIEIPELKHEPAEGKVGLIVAGDYAPAWFANFRWRELDAPPFERIPVVPVDLEGAVMNWDVSSPFDGAALVAAVDIEQESLAQLSWRSLASEANGVANLARLHGVGQGADTVFARTTLRAMRSSVRRVGFGYSDRVRVYLNGRLMYEGDRTAFSRDYRYLGTIGPYDSLYLPLHEGENELLFAVTERFGGWGLMAKLEESRD
jgi:hypothetical protein